MQKHNGTKEQYEQFVKLTVDGLVTQSDFPVIGQALISAEIADRKMLRKLVHDGILKTIYVTAGRGIITGYFTEDVLPKFERERRAKADGTDIQPEQPNNGEELVEAGEETGRDAEHVQEVGQENYSRDRETDGIDYEDDSGVVSSEGI